MMVFYEFLDFLKNSCFEENLTLDVKIYTSWQNNMLWCFIPFLFFGDHRNFFVRCFIVRTVSRKLVKQNYLVLLWRKKQMRVKNHYIKKFAKLLYVHAKNLRMIVKHIIIIIIINSLFFVDKFT